MYTKLLMVENTTTEQDIKAKTDTDGTKILKSWLNTCQLHKVQ